MNEMFSIDEAIVQKLPLPLAQLARRAANAKTPLDRQLAAYYVWEAGLKLLASAAIVEYTARDDHDPALAERLRNLARPSVGHWWEFVRRLVPVLADAGDPGFAEVRDMVLGRSRDDLPRAAGLDAALLGAEEGRGAARNTVRLTELFDRLVAYRNREIGHGATGQRPAEFYDRMARALLAGVCQVFERVDVLAGRRLIHVDDVRRLASGDWQVYRFELIGEGVRRAESLTVPEAEAASLPRPGLVYLEGGPGGPRAHRCLHPLVCFEPETRKVYFLSARRGKQQAEYLCYDGGDTLHRPLDADQRSLLAGVLGQPVDAVAADAWAAQSLAGEGPPDPAAAAAPEGRTVGEFEKLSLLGKGGMGVVYRAWQPSLGRQVALKCMIRGGDPKAEERFSREIRALGRVEHPNVVKVYTSGSDGDQFFYVMELVEGAELAGVCEQLAGRDVSAVDETTWRQALTSACAKVRSNERPLSESRPASGRPPSGGEADPGAPDAKAGRDQPPPAPGGPGYVRRAVDIMARVADAAHSLHEAGVVHRDIKPGNIMMTADGRTPVLMDLGLAQLADEADGRLTRTRQFVGTIRYASPEQVLSAGRVDRRTDVYSLGATLWELLTLRPIFGAGEETADHELMLRIQSKEPESPRRFNPNVPRDLEAIVLKCLEKDRGRRYATAADLAADLGRFLRGEPVTAQPPSLSYLASKFVRRFRVPLGVAASILVLAVVGTVAAFLQINAERAAAITARNSESKEKEKAQQALDDLTKSRRESEIVSNIVDQQYSSVKEENIRHLPGLSSVQEELAAIRLEGMTKLAAANPDDATVTPRLAAAHTILGMIRAHVGSFERARANLQAAVDLYQKLADKAPDDPEHRLHLCRTLFESGWLYWSNSQYAEALRYFDRAATLAEAALKADPKDPAFRYELARALATTGSAGLADEPRRKAMERARSLLEPLLAEKYRETDVRAAMIVADSNAAWARWDGKDQGTLRAAFSKVHEEEDELLKLRPDSPHVRAYQFSYHYEMADSLARSGKADEALAHREKAVDAARGIVKSTPEAGRFQRLLAAALFELGNSLRSKQRQADARAAYEECNQVMDALVRRFADRSYYAAEWVRLRFGTSDLFMSAASAGGDIQAGQIRLRLLDQAVQRGREFGVRFPADPYLHRQLARALNMRGQYDLDAERKKEAYPLLAEAVETFRTHVLPAEPAPASEFVLGEFIGYARKAAEAAEALGRTDDVVRLSREALEVGRGCQAPDTVWDLAATVAAAARLHEKDGRDRDAIAANVESVRLAAPAFEKVTWHWYLRTFLGGAWFRLAELYHKVGDVKNEVLAHREYLRLVGGPFNGLKVDEYLDPSRPTDEAEAVRLRALLKKAPGMKRFTVPCDFNGVKYPFHVYVSDAPWPKDPLEDQARWLLEVRGGTIPEEVRDSFRRLHKIAHENNVSFQDLCVYALGTAAAENGQKVQVSEAGAGARGTAIPAGQVNVSSGSVTPSGVDLQAPLKARLVDLKTKLDNAPNDLVLLQESASVYDALARSYFSAGNDAGALKAWEPCLATREALARARPLDVPTREDLAGTYQSIARVHARANDFEKAYLMYHRQIDVLETVLAETYSARARAAVTETQRLIGELFDARGDRVEAVRWELKAMARGDTQAARKVAGLIELSPDYVALLPKDAQAVFARAREMAKADKKAVFADLFVRELDKSNREQTERSTRIATQERDQKVALLGAAAEQFRSLAEGYVRDGKKDQAFDMYRKEADLRGQQVAASPNDPKLKATQGKAATDAGRLAADIGQDQEAARLLLQAVSLGHLEAYLPLADLYERGKGVARKPDMAELYRRGFYSRRGNDAFAAKRYADAIPDLKTAADLTKDAPLRSQLQDRIGMCHGKLGRWDEALAAYTQAFETAPDGPKAPWIVLNLVEAMVCADRPGDAIRFFESLDRRSWAPKLAAADVIRFQGLSLGYRAIALRVSGKDAGEAEKRLAAFLDRPNVHVTGWSWDETDGWLARAKADGAALEAVKKIVADLRAPSKELTSRYFPMKVGSEWAFKYSNGNKIIAKCAGRDSVGGREYYKLEYVSGGKVTFSEYYVIEPDGLYRQYTGTIMADPAIKCLPLPPREGDTWESDVKVWSVPPTPNDKPLPVGIRGSVRVEAVKVPAGTFEKAVVGETRRIVNKKETIDTTWWVEDVGPVKFVTKSADGETVRELEKYTPGPAGAAK